MKTEDKNLSLKREIPNNFFRIPNPQLSRSFALAIRENDHKKMEEILAKIPAEDVKEIKRELEKRQKEQQESWGVEYVYSFNDEEHFKIWVVSQHTQEKKIIYQSKLKSAKEMLENFGYTFHSQYEFIKEFIEKSSQAGKIKPMLHIGADDMGIFPEEPQPEILMAKIPGLESIFYNFKTIKGELADGLLAIIEIAQILKKYPLHFKLWASNLGYIGASPFAPFCRRMLGIYPGLLAFSLLPQTRKSANAQFDSAFYGRFETSSNEIESAYRMALHVSAGGVCALSEGLTFLVNNRFLELLKSAITSLEFTSRGQKDLGLMRFPSNSGFYISMNSTNPLPFLKRDARQPIYERFVLLNHSEIEKISIEDSAKLQVLFEKHRQNAVSVFWEYLRYLHKNYSGSKFLFDVQERKKIKTLCGNERLDNSFAILENGLQIFVKFINNKGFEFPSDDYSFFDELKREQIRLFNEANNTLRGILLSLFFRFEKGGANEADVKPLKSGSAGIFFDVDAVIISKSAQTYLKKQFDFAFSNLSDFGQQLKAEGIPFKDPTTHKVNFEKEIRSSDGKIETERGSDQVHGIKILKNDVFGGKLPDGDDNE